MRKFTLLMMSLFFAMTAWAQTTSPTALPEVSSGETIKWYTIKNTRSGKFLNYAGDAKKMTQTPTASASSFFYFTAPDETAANGYTPVYIHNYATSNKMAGMENWNTDGIVWYLSVDATNGENPKGLHVTTEKNHTGWNAWNDYNQTEIGDYYSADAGGIFVFAEVTDFTAIIDVPAAKTAAIAEINNLATVNVIYSAATTDAADAINAVTPASKGLADLNAAIEEINAIVANYKTAAYEALSGKYYTIKTLSKERSKGFMQMTTSNIVGTETASTPANLWQFVENNGAVNIYNPYMKLYMCEPQGNSAEIAVTANQNEAGAYHLVVNADAENADAKIKFTSNSKSVHMAGGHNLVRWDNGGASEWQVALVEDFSTMISEYKTSKLATLDQWAPLSVVFDANLIASARGAINAINTTDFATFAAIDAEITKVTDAVAAKMFTFQTVATDNHRENVWVSANASTGKAIGLHGESNYNSIWSLRHAAGSSFYMFNELNQVYMGAPSANCPLTETPSVAYTFEIIKAEDGIVEMKCNGETLHASNHNDDKLLNWDGDEDASRWYISTIDIAADIQAILDALTEEDYADVPALGQYTTAAYNALVAARTNAKTVEEVEAAIAAFKKAKNRPAYLIESQKESYAKNMSIYENADNGNLYFKSTNKYDKTMLWAMDQTETGVKVTDRVALVNVSTGNNFWGAEFVSIIETEPAVDNDSIFMFKTGGTGSPVHAQQSGSQIVRWSSADANAVGGASTWKFIYVGDTYSIDKLTDGHITALSALKDAYDNKANFVNAEIGAGLGQYGEGDVDAIAAAAAAAKKIVDATVAEQATMTVDAINAAATELNEAVATLVINMPAAGKYYRIQGACEASLSGYYITGHTNEDGGRIALTNEADASTIYYFDGTNLIAYQSGLVVGLNDSHWTFASVDDNSKPASTITFDQSPRTTGAYTVNSANRYFHYTVYNETVQVNRCQDDVCKEHDWYLTEVTELPVTISAAEHATFFAPVAVEVAAGVTAHTVTINGEWATLSEALEVIPANTGVVLQGAEGTYDFAITTSDATATSALEGTVAATCIEKDACVLSNGTNGIGFYGAILNKKNNTAFLNNSHKAYLAVEGASEISFYGFRFGDEEGATGVENVEIATENAVIFDLTGRRVSEITAPGIYIIGGRKVLVK